MLDFLTCRLDRYRSFGTPNQFPVKNREEIIWNIQKFNNQKDCFISICEIDDYNNFYPLWFFIDLDSSDDNQDLVNDDAAKILNWIEENDLTFILDESGHKGLHFLLELNQTHRYYNNHFRAFYFYLLNKLDLQTIDSCCCEVRRLCRVSGTIHPISGKLCCTLLKKEANPLNLFDFIENIEYKNIDSKYECKDYKCPVGESRFIFPFPHYCPCIDEEVKGEDIDHNIRWRWIKVLQKRGLSFKEIYNECEEAGWSDFTPSITEYQIRYCLNNNYVLKCKKEICIDRCPLRKNIKK